MPPDPVVAPGTRLPCDAAFEAAASAGGKASAKGGAGASGGPLTAFTVSAWVRFDSWDVEYPMIATCTSGSFQFHGMGPGYGERCGRLTFYTYTQGGRGPHGRGIEANDGCLITSEPLEAGQWYYVVAEKAEHSLSVWVVHPGGEGKAAHVAPRVVLTREEAGPHADVEQFATKPVGEAFVFGAGRSFEHNQALPGAIAGPRCEPGAVGLARVREVVDAIAGEGPEDSGARVTGGGGGGGGAVGTTLASVLHDAARAETAMDLAVVFDDYAARVDALLAPSAAATGGGAGAGDATSSGGVTREALVSLGRELRREFEGEWTAVVAPSFGRALGACERLRTARG